jgi:hypothetical protein
LLALAARARADGFVVDSGSPRSIGRAGVGTVSDDGGGALLVDPAALARRQATRAQLGIAWSADSIDWLDDDPSAPVARGQAASSIVPFAAFAVDVRGFVVAVAAMTSGATDRALRPVGQLPPTAVGNLFDYRYTGSSGSLRRDTATIGAAHRLGDSVAIGASVALSRVAISEQRRIWAGFSGTATVGDPAHDVDLTLSGVGWSPSAVAGVLVAPTDTRVELAASLGIAQPATATGGVTVATAPTGSLVSASSDGATARIDLPQVVTLRTGARWLGDRWIVEVDGDLWLLPASAAAPVWQLVGVHVVDASTATADVTALPSRASARTHGAVRAAIDVELAAGFLWATAGYAYRSSGTDSARLSATFGELESHTAALGLEATAGGYTLTLGWSHAWAISRAPATTRWSLDNPFAAGDAAVPLGTYRGGGDVVGIFVDAEL